MSKQVIELTSKKIFNSVSSAAMYYGFSSSSLSLCISKRFGVTKSGLKVFAILSEIDTSNIEMELQTRLAKHNMLHKGHVAHIRACKTSDGQVFESEVQAAEELGLAYSTISRSIFDGTKVKGVVLSFADEYNHIMAKRRAERNKKKAWWAQSEDFNASVAKMIAHVDRCESLRQDA